MQEPDLGVLLLAGHRRHDQLSAPRVDVEPGDERTIVGGIEPPSNIGDHLGFQQEVEHPIDDPL